MSCCAAVLAVVVCVVLLRRRRCGGGAVRCYWKRREAIIEMMRRSTNLVQTNITHNPTVVIAGISIILVQTIAARGIVRINGTSCKGKTFCTRVNSILKTFFFLNDYTLQRTSIPGRRKARTSSELVSGQILMTSRHQSFSNNEMK